MAAPMMPPIYCPTCGTALPRVLEGTSWWHRDRIRRILARHLITNERQCRPIDPSTRGRGIPSHAPAPRVGATT